MTESGDWKCVGYRDGLVISVTENLLAQKGEQYVLERLGLTKRFPVKTDIYGNEVLVEGSSQQDAIDRYLNRTKMK